MAGYLTIPLDSKHKKSEFTCGNTYLDNYLKKQAKQDIKRKLSACFILSSVPVTLLGRLAINEKNKSQGLGKLLLIDALKRSYEVSKVIGSMAVIVDPIDESAIKFYNKFGFITLPDSKKMFLSMKTIEQLFK